MRTFFQDLVTDPFGIIWPALLLAATMLAGFVVRKLLFRAVSGWAKSDNSRVDVIVQETLGGPLILWALILGAHLALQNSGMPRQYLKFAPQVLEVLWILSLTIAMGRLAGNLVKFYGGRVTGAQAVTSLTQKLAQLTVMLVGTVWVLKVVFDLSLTPILTTLGVGGLAVALALQDTLSNLFAGFYVSISGLVRIGDYIRLDAGQEGFVTDINWRCTTMRSQGNSLVVIPNAKLGQAIYTNYGLPDPRLATTVVVTVGHEADIERVERILREEAMAGVTEIAGAVREPAPYVLFTPGPGELGLGFQVTFSVSGFELQQAVLSEMRKRIHLRLKREGIAVAPVRVIQATS